MSKNWKNTDTRKPTPPSRPQHFEHQNDLPDQRQPGTRRRQNEGHELRHEDQGADAAQNGMRKAARQLIIVAREAADALADIDDHRGTLLSTTAIISAVSVSPSQI